MKKRLSLLALLCMSVISIFSSCAYNTGKGLYLFESRSTPAWASFENRKAQKGAGGIRNNGAKGSAIVWILPQEDVILMEDEACGIIHRMWLTISDRSSEVLRSVKLEMYWDGASKPAVSVPLGDFFCSGTGMKKPFQSALFEDPEGRSFVSYAQMPYRKGARVILKNESEQAFNLCYDVNFSRQKKLPKGAMYFHTYFNHDPATTVGVDHKVLPEIKGKGRFMGMSVGVITNPAYGNNWWGEGEVKIYLDGDTEYPSLVGTGTEDYVGTAWGQGSYSTPYQGCIVAGEDSNWSFYRFHIPDPIYFQKDIRVALQQIGGCSIEDYRVTIADGAPLIPISVENLDTHEFHRLYELGNPDPLSFGFENAWVNYFRSDNVASTAYFYHESPFLP